MKGTGGYVIDMPENGAGPSMVAHGSARRLATSGKPAVVLESASTGGQLFILEQRVGPKALGMPHTHAREDQIAYVLDGEIGYRVGTEEYLASAGSTVFKPRGVPHTTFNRTDQIARMLEITLPGGFQDYFDTLDRLFRGPDRVPPEELNRIAEEYGLSAQREWIAELEQKYGVSWRAGS
jgi:quercetin dioxygenase-like cupin family protein